MKVSFFICLVRMRLQRYNKKCTKTRKRAKVYFQVSFFCFWAALCERTFEVGERSEVGAPRRYKCSRDARTQSKYTHAHTQVERTEVWSAFCERSYGGIGESCVENMGGMIRQGSVRSTTKNGDVQKNIVFSS
jgi:hypothetical protein